MNNLAVAPFVLALVGCASQPAAQSVRPAVDIEQVSSAKPFLASMSTAVPVDFRLDVTNPLDNEVKLVSVEFEALGDTGGYELRRVRHAFSQSIPAHGSASIDLRAWVYPRQVSDTGRVVSAVLLRGIARFDSPGGKITTAFSGRMGQ